MNSSITKCANVYMRMYADRRTVCVSMDMHVSGECTCMNEWGTGICM